MKIKQCDLCKLIKAVPITSISIPTLHEGQVAMRKFDLCPECLESLALHISGFLDEKTKKEDIYEF